MYTNQEFIWHWFLFALSKTYWTVTPLYRTVNFVNRYSLINIVERYIYISLKCKIMPITIFGLYNRAIAYTRTSLILWAVYEDLLCQVHT